MFVTFFHYAALVGYTLFSVLKLQNNQLGFMRSLTNQLIFDHPKAYAIVKNLNAQEIEDNLFCSEKDIESNSSS